jgi:hypothetical protein
MNQNQQLQVGQLDSSEKKVKYKKNRLKKIFNKNKKSFIKYFF